jgi:hypothetical protein
MKLWHKRITAKSRRRYADYGRLITGLLPELTPGITGDQELGHDRSKAALADHQIERARRDLTQSDRHGGQLNRIALKNDVA